MPDIGCCEAMRSLNIMLDDRVLGSRRDEVLARLERGDPLNSLATEFGLHIGAFVRHNRAEEVNRVIKNWPPAHAAMIRGVVVWALTERKNGNSVKIRWYGNDDNPETITRVTFKNDEVVIEFAHPPFPPHRLTSPSDIAALLQEVVQNYYDGSNEAAAPLVEAVMANTAGE